MTFIQIEINQSNGEQRDLVMALLSDIGFEGFEETEISLKAFISKDNFKKEELDQVARQSNFTYTITEILPQNWNAQWESSFEPVVVNDFAAIRASFHPPIKTVKHEIIITPKMSFGTGHHATTYLMIEQMSHLNFQNKAVLDFGTGTAVLAILAEKMGAAEICAIDNDEWSIENARENIGVNNCTKIRLIRADNLLSLPQYDIILANINLNVIKSALEQITQICKPGAIILFSGFLTGNLAELKQDLDLCGIFLKGYVEKGEWLCIMCTYGG